MKKILAAALYTALTLGANAAMAQDTAVLAALRDGDMKKLNFHAMPATVAALDIPFVTADGGEGRLSDHAGQYVLLNFWATWCAPCRKEMPMLAALQEEFGGEAFQVVTIATGRNSPGGIDRFFNEIGVTNLPRHRDPKQAIARQMAVLGLPITVILDPEGQEIARLRGDADWASDSARAIIARLLAGE